MKYFYLLLIFLLFLTSCKKDPCEDINCPATAVCVEGVCNCMEGYEGASCETEMRDKFLGSYTGTITQHFEEGGPDPVIIAEDATLTVIATGSAVSKMSINLLSELLLLQMSVDSEPYKFYFDELEDLRVSGKNVILSKQYIFEEMTDATNGAFRVYVSAEGQIDGDILQVEILFSLDTYNEDDELVDSGLYVASHELYFFKN